MDSVSDSNPQSSWNSTSDFQAADYGSTGGDDNLWVTLFKFTPNVVCSGSVSGRSAIVESCQGMVDRMFAGRGLYTFLPKDTAMPFDRQIGLPYIDKAPVQDSRTIRSASIVYN